MVPESKGPPPGAYELPDKLGAKEKLKENAVFKSKAEKSTNFIIGKGNPGTGAYENFHQKCLANREFQGGAPNNFVLYTKQGYKLREPDTKEVPRIMPITVGSSKYNFY